VQQREHRQGLTHMIALLCNAHRQWRTRGRGQDDPQLAAATRELLGGTG
jgi:hypothetical protein